MTGPVHAAPGTRFRIRVPATSANLGSGFDALGLALARWDTYTVEAIADPGACSVAVHGEGADTVSADEANLVVASMRAAAAAAGTTLPPFSLRCDNGIPHGRGLGSSAAAIVGGVLAGRALAGLGRDPAAELVLAARLEGHPDNVAAALLGGLTIAWREEQPGGGTAARAVGLRPAGLALRVFVPPAAMSTTLARGLLPPVVPHADAAHAAGRSALLVAALLGAGEAGGADGPDGAADGAGAAGERRATLLAATEDRLHQDARGPAMPVTADLIGRLRAAGVAAVLSGSGPSVLAIGVAGADGPRWGALDPPAGWSVLDTDVAGPACCAMPPGQDC